MKRRCIAIEVLPPRPMAGAIARTALQFRSLAKSGEMVAFEALVSIFASFVKHQRRYKLRKSKTPVLYFKEQTFELNNQTSDFLLNSLNEYFIKAPTLGSPGDKNFVSGKVNSDEQTFIVYPIITSWGNRRFIRLFVYGKIKNDKIKIKFGTPLSHLLPNLILFGLVISILLSDSLIGFRSLTIPLILVMILVNLIAGRIYYKKDVRNHLEFLHKLLSLRSSS